MTVSRGQRFGLVIAVLLTLSGCSGGGGGDAVDSAGGLVGSGASGGDGTASSGSMPNVVSGSVGDGPVIGATLRVVDARGEVLGFERSSETADYRLELAADTRLPVLVTATGGIDLVTMRELDFPLVGAVLQTGSVTVNVAPLTTVAVRAAQCSAAGLSATGLDAAWARIYEQFSFGLDERVVGDPMSDPVTETNVGTLVLANEALGEAVRRSMAALEAAGSPVDGEEILRQLGCNLMGETLTGAVDPQVLAVLRAAELAVRLEALAGRLEVDGYSATARMDDAIRVIRPETDFDSVATLPIPYSARLQAGRAATLWLDFAPSAPDAGLVGIAVTLEQASDQLLALRLDAALDDRLHGWLKDLPALVALADRGDVEALAVRHADQGARLPPSVAFSASAATVTTGESVLLTWAATNADQCVASGDWAGVLATEGFRQSVALTGNVRFGITCAGLGGTAYRELPVAVMDPPAPAEPVAELPQEQPGEHPGLESGPGGESGGEETVTVVLPPEETGSGSEPVAELPQEQPGEHPGIESGPGGESGGEETVAVVLPPEETGSGSEPVETAPAPSPTVSLGASEYAISKGGSVTLDWSTTEADQCDASGGWAGSRPVTGPETVGPLETSTTFTLSCTGAGGTAMAMLSVSVNGAVVLRWQAPTEHEDGTPITALQAYRIYYGSHSGHYVNYDEIGAEIDSEYSLQLPPGDYFIAMTAIGLDGQESAYSNEVYKVVN